MTYTYARTALVDERIPLFHESITHVREMVRKLGQVADPPAAPPQLAWIDVDVNGLVRALLVPAGQVFCGFFACARVARMESVYTRS